MGSPAFDWRQVAHLTAGEDMWSTHALPAIGLKSVRFSDGPMGITGGRVDERDLALLTPCGLALAASWDGALVRRVGQVVGDEALRLGIQGILAPNLNLMRSPLAGRAFELFGEDPLLISHLGGTWAEGVQSRGVASVIKHLVCNDSETDRRNMNVAVDEQTLREVYFRPFEYTATRGAWGMLTAYNSVNGVRCAELGQAIGWLKQGLGWDGLVMSDWFGTHDGVASLKAGLDLEMPGPARHMGKALAETASVGKHVVDAAQRLQRLAERVANPTPYDASTEAETERKQVLEEAAAAGMVLLRNDGLLPLNPSKAKRVAVIGPNALQPCFQGGTFAKVALDPATEMPLTSIAARFADVQYAEGVVAEYRIPPLTLSRGAVRVPLNLNVTFRDAEGREVHQETRHASSLIWFKHMPGVGDLLSLKGTANVTARTIMKAERSGTHRFFVGGTGEVSLFIDGLEQASFDGVTLSGDIMGKLMQSPHTTVDIALEAGQQVALEFSMNLGRSLAHGLWFGCRPPVQADLLERAVALAREVDSVVLMVGETADAGLESVDRDTTELSAAQQSLIRAVCEVNPRTVVVLNVAHPVDTSCLNQAAAVIVAWYPGQGFGPALASVLSGDREPGGRLPVTFAAKEQDYPAWSLTPDANGDLRYHEQWWVGYRHFAANALKPAYSFGYGLGYATIEPEVAQLFGEQVDELSVSLSLLNSSTRPGKAVPQLYLQGPTEDGQPDRYSLEAFHAVEVPAAGRAVANLVIEARSFSRWDCQAQDWRLRPGLYRLTLGASSTECWFQLALYIDEKGRVDAGAWHSLFAQLIASSDTTTPK
ncbi:glycoside hydrolase family 3 C-terminal domain-containing protein [Pseudomonas sp. A2]|uniref:beta-glucosidase family protein n=1 Tax=Pseudomonas sp. A2 TaxID=107445 RepID=UPI002CCFF69D|nr:glycoside hydrolase family 3 C-terminal domain-containing protein [Pseudomonas sp. A2]MEB3440337.1 glycoside hydrolase family 3 C-terminal domain-containing protein [Pseudomonas sp. A2]